MDIEATFFHDPNSTLHTQQSTDLLHECCDPLIEANQSAVVAISEWLGQVRSRRRFAFWRSAKERKKLWQANYDALAKRREDLQSLLQRFKSDDRFKVLDPYRPALEAKGDVEQDSPSHRYLFHCYVYQYHLMRFTCQIIEMVKSSPRGIPVELTSFFSLTRSFVSSKSDPRIVYGLLHGIFSHGTPGIFPTFKMMRKTPV